MGTGIRILPVTGPPGAGKSTALIALTARHPRLARFGVRDYGLQLAAAGDPLGLRVRSRLLRGELLGDAVVRQEFIHFLERLPGGVEAVAVEGYPRDTGQCAQFMETVRESGVENAGLVVVDVPDDVARSRVAGRRICTDCGRPVADPRQRCGHCGGPTAVRGDDARDHLERRLAEYRGLSAEVQAYFRDRGLLHTIDGQGDPQRVQEALLRTLLSRDTGPVASARDPIGSEEEEE